MARVELPAGVSSWRSSSRASFVRVSPGRTGGSATLASSWTVAAWCLTRPRRRRARGRRALGYAGRPPRGGARGRRPAPSSVGSGGSEAAIVPRSYGNVRSARALAFLPPLSGAHPEHGDGAVRCPSCGFHEYANPAPTVSALVRDDRGRNPPRPPCLRAGRPASGISWAGSWMRARSRWRRSAGSFAKPALNWSRSEFLGALPDTYGPGQRDHQLLGGGAWRRERRDRRTTSPSSPGSPRRAAAAGRVCVHEHRRAPGSARGDVHLG